MNDVLQPKAQDLASAGMLPTLLSVNTTQYTVRSVPKNLDDFSWIINGGKMAQHSVFDTDFERLAYLKLKLLYLKTITV